MYINIKCIAIYNMLHEQLSYSIKTSLLGAHTWNESVLKTISIYTRHGVSPGLSQIISMLSLWR